MRAVIFVMLLAVGQTFVPVPGKTSNSQIHSKHASSNHQRPAPATVIKLSASTKVKQDGRGKQSNAESQEAVTVRKPVTVSVKGDWWNRAYILATCALVLVGLIGIWFARRSLIAVEQQSRTAKIAAEAAKITAQTAKSQIDAQIAANRPWLLVKGIEDPYLTPLVEVPPPDRRFAHCIFSVENSGKTPARIIATQAELWIGDRVDIPPAQFKLQADQDVNEEDGYIFPASNTKQTEARLNPTGVISPEERDGVINGTKFLWLCGVIRYRDTFERRDTPDYETRFCYRYETRLNVPKPFWTPAGAPEYNRAT